MWKIPAVAVGSFVVKKIIDRKNNKVQNTQLSRLEHNFLRLSENLCQFSGKKVALIGQPGAGKSMLLYSVTEGKCIPKPFISPKTDATDWSESESIPLTHSLEYEHGVTLFIDTPGYGTSKHPQSSYSFFPFDSVSKVIFVVQGKLHQTDQEMFSLLIHQGLQENLAIVRTLSENLTEEDQIKVKIDFNKNLRYKYLKIPLFFVSNRSGEGISALNEWI